MVDDFMEQIFPMLFPCLQNCFKKHLNKFFDKKLCLHCAVCTVVLVYAIFYKRFLLLLVISQLSGSTSEKVNMPLLTIQSECRKIRAKKLATKDTFHAVCVIRNNQINPTGQDNFDVELIGRREGRWDPVSQISLIFVSDLVRSKFSLPFPILSSFTMSISATLSKIYNCPFVE